MHLVRGKQRRRVNKTSGVEAASNSPAPARRIVQFRARKNVVLEEAMASACNKDHAIGEQGRRVIIARGVEAASGSPGPVGRIVQFRARNNDATSYSPRDQHHAVRQQGRRVSFTRARSGMKKDCFHPASILEATTLRQGRGATQYPDQLREQRDSEQ
jgi:hypothetical protein